LHTNDVSRISSDIPPFGHFRTLGNFGIV